MGIKLLLPIRVVLYTILSGILVTELPFSHL